MNITHQEIHDLTGVSARLNAIVSLLRDPESRGSLDMDQVDKDVRIALENFSKIWNQALVRGKKKT
jgi:hypothetical protein